MLAMLLIVSFGLVMFYLSTETAQSIADQKGLTKGLTGVEVLAMKQRIDHIARYSFLFLSLGSVVFMWLMFTMMFSITPALRRIKYAIQEIGKGNVAYRLDLPLNNELGELAKTLNFSLDKVSESQLALLREKAQVDQQIEQRTKQLKVEQAKFLASINGLPVGFMLVNRSGHLTMLNPAMGQMLELKAATDKEFDHHVADAGNLLRQILDSMPAFTGSSQPSSKTITTSTGRYLRALFSPLAIEGTEEKYMVIIVEDVTEAKQLENSKDEFLSIASHELRTPLTAIRGNAELITMFYKDNLAQDQRLSSIVQSIYNSSGRLIAIVNDFLDVSKLEQGKIEIQSKAMALGEVIDTVLAEIAAVAKQKQVYVKANTDDMQSMSQVYADPDRVEQVIYNLVGNALKFVEEGGVTIKAKPIEGFLKVFIIDTGRGISPENQQLLFRKFEQAHSGMKLQDTVPGTGLGLYISKLLVEIMGGKIALESSESGVGSTFSFTLPLVDSHSDTSIVNT